MPRIGVGVGSVSNLDATISSRAAAADYTTARAAGLDALLATADLRIGTAGVSKVWPADSAAVSISTGGVAWTFGSWGQIVAAANIGAAALLGLFIWQNGNAEGEYVLEVGQGGAGSEVTVARFPFSMHVASAAGFSVWLPLWLPKPRALTTDARLAVRAEGTLTTTAVLTKLIVGPTPF